MISGIDNRKLNNNWYLVTFYNKVDGTSFVWKPLSPSISIEHMKNLHNQTNDLVESKYSSGKLYLYLFIYLFVCLFVYNLFTMFVCSLETNLSSIWPLNKHQPTKITVITAVDNE